MFLVAWSTSSCVRGTSTPSPHIVHISWYIHGIRYAGFCLVFMYVFMYIHTYCTCMHACNIRILRNLRHKFKLCSCIHVYVHTCVHTYIHTCMRAHTHTYTHTHYMLLILFTCRCQCTQTRREVNNDIFSIILSLLY